jgi:hypothetical protein
MRGALLAVGFLLVASAIAASADTPSGQLQYFVGTWSCDVHATAANFSETRTTAALAGSVWIHSTGTATEKNQVLASEDTYLGYDERNSRFVLVGITSAGGYFVATSGSRTLNGSSWTDDFPNDGSTATLVENSTSQYTTVTTATDGAKTQTVCARK